MKKKFLVGIDEVGRGPLAGPVAVGVVMGTHEAISVFCEIKESKQLSEKKREVWNKKIIAASGEDLMFAVVHVEAGEIDGDGIVSSIAKALKRGLVEIGANPEDCRVLLDGGLHAPKEFLDQETIIGGDAKEVVIAMASVVAKVSRDHHMVALHGKYPAYNFAQHKGYGTKTHMDAIRQHGLSEEHRRSFCKNVTKNENHG